MDRLMILGSTRLTSEIVREAKRLGVYTVVTDWNPIEKAPAKREADKYYDVSITDVDGLLNIIRAEGINGIITGFADSYLKYYCDICNAAKLPCYGTEEQFNTFINKHIYKKLCREYDIPTIDEYDADELSDSEYVKETVRFPVLIKPSDNSGARGISICNTYDELQDAYKKAMLFSVNKKVLAERYIKGREATAFYLINNGNVHFIGIADRHLGHEQEGCIGLPVAYSFPSIYTESYYYNERIKTEEMFKGIGLKNGMLFLQYLIEDGLCHVYDIGYRLTGSLEYNLTQYAAGFNHMDMMIHFALTGKMWDDDFDISRLDYRKLKNVYNITILGKPGRIEKITGIEDINHIDGVITSAPALLEGNIIEERYVGTLAQVVLRVFCHADSTADLDRILKKISQVYKVIDSEGNDMLLPMFRASVLDDYR